MSRKIRYAVIGASSRALTMYCKPIQTTYSDVADLTGIMDINPERIKALNSYLKEPVPAFADFGEMINQSKPDKVIITTKDSVHHKYIIAALRAGKDVIVEKPMTIDNDKCRAILNAQRETGKAIIVTFNYRFIPIMRKLKQMVMEKTVGDLESIDFHWYLDTIHGADYFRRWHREMANSGGLLVHKATHHFDLMNWIIDSEPDTVFANGKLSFYGNKKDLRNERCLTCKHKENCNFFFDLTKDEKMRSMYLDSEKSDGYIRDACVFSDKIDIYDNMSLTVKYRNNTFLTYSLIAYAPYEGWRMSINGNKGRIDIDKIERITFQESFMKTEMDTIRVYPLFREPYTITVKKEHGNHGGGDKVLLDVLFRNKNGTIKKLNIIAGAWEGAMALLIGVAANKSIASGKPIKIIDLLI